MTRSGSGRIVAIGGGHGLSVVLGALVDRCDHLTAVVSVADDGGSSGRLRRDLGIVAPGDMRRCLAALAPAGIVRDALEYRFDTGVLDGHPAGNVMLASMLEVEDDIVAVMDAMVAMVGARGRVLPATSGKVDLIASAARGTVKGQVAVSESDAIKSLRFAPDEPDVPDEVIAAIDQADVVVLGPGSLYTSVLAALVPGIRAALEATDALVVYVANLAAESTETEGYGGVFWQGRVDGLDVHAPGHAEMAEQGERIAARWLELKEEILGAARHRDEFRADQFAAK